MSVCLESSGVSLCVCDVYTRVHTVCDDDVCRSACVEHVCVCEFWFKGTSTVVLCICSLSWQLIFGRSIWEVMAVTNGVSGISQTCCNHMLTH